MNSGPGIAVPHYNILPAIILSVGIGMGYTSLVPSRYYLQVKITNFNVLKYTTAHIMGLGGFPNVQY